MDRINQDIERCDFCGTCVAVCPHDAIELYEARLEIDREKCTMCLNCVHICPFRSLEPVNEK